MSKYILKPVFWNSANYQRPSGAKASSGYPAQHGYGHEEWNNSERLSFEHEGRKMHAFHTEGVSSINEADDGDVFVFLYASNEGSQYLVSAAGYATWLGDREGTREYLADTININKLAGEAWAVQRVKSAYDNDYNAFKKEWNKERTWIPNWACPADYFFAPASPIPLDPTKITDASKLLTMYSGHTPIGLPQAVSVLLSVPAEMRTQQWNSLYDSLATGTTDAATDVHDISIDENMVATTRRQMIDARLGQGYYRQRLMARWSDGCAVTGCRIPQLIRASHIKPWRDASANERLDPANGLLLSANLDALFDRGLITFSDAGEMLTAEQLSRQAYPLQGVPLKLRREPDEAEKKYLAHHRRVWRFE